MEIWLHTIQKSEQIRDSNDDLHEQESTSVDTTQEELIAHDNVENIGAFNTLTNPPPFENVDFVCLH